MQIVTLITDYGTRDHYVGVLKGVILRIAPDVRLVDITHEVDPHDVLQGAFILRQIWPWFPAGTIHLAVVDPGVGTDRRVILGQYADQYVVAPDNGLVTLVHRDLPVEAMHVVEDRHYFLPELSATFHGRDLMAPVVGHLANGVKPGDFGPVADRLEMLPVPHCGEVKSDGVHGKVLYVDRFGTLLTNIRREQLAAIADSSRIVDVEVDGTSVGPVRATFGDVPPGEPIAVVGSCGLLEIAVNQGSAAERFGAVEAVRVLGR